MMEFDIKQRPEARTNALASRGGCPMAVTYMAGWRVISRMRADIG